MFRPGLLTVLLENIASTDIDTLLKKCCQYFHQYFLKKTWPILLPITDTSANINTSYTNLAY